MKLNSLNRTLIIAALATAASTTTFAAGNMQPPKNRVPIEKARVTATSKSTGKITSEELEFEGGKWIYSFDLQVPNDKRIHEVHVDAISGRLLDSHVETAADEAKEAADEQ